MNLPSLCSFRKLSLLLVIIAAVLQRGSSQEADTGASSSAAVVVSNATATEPPFRCLSICGEDEGELEEPDKVVEYQWNHRVPVCAGLSCDTSSSCAQLDSKLSLLEMNELECARHKRRLQKDAGCTCSEAKPFVDEPVDTAGPDKSSSSGSTTTTGGTTKTNEKRGWIIVGIIMGALLAIFILLWLGVRYDEKAAAKKKKEADESPGEP